MPLKTKFWVSAVLLCVMAIFATVGVSMLTNIQEVSAATATQTATFVKLDQATTNAQWEGTYGKDGYIIPANVNNTWWQSTGFYSDMYEGNDGKTGIQSTQTSDTRNGTAYYNTAAVSLKANAPITRWGYGANYFNGGAAKEVDTLLLPGTENTYGQVDIKNAASYYADMSIFFTKATNEKQLVTIYISDLNSNNYGMNVNTYVYATHKMAYNMDATKTTTTTAFYGSDYIANYQFSINKNNSDYNAYLTFELEGAGDYEIVVSGGYKNWTVPSIQGLFFDEMPPQLATPIMTDATTGPDWENTYGSDGYLVFEGAGYSNASWHTYTGFYSDMYDNASGLIRGKNRADSANLTYIEPMSTDVTLKADAIVSRWGVATKAWWVNGMPDSVYIPGTETQTYAMLGNGINTNAADMSVFFTLNTNDKVYVTIHVWGAWEDISEDAPMDVYVFPRHKMMRNSGEDIVSFYGAPIAYKEITSAGYVTFALQGAGDYEIVVGAATQQASGDAINKPNIAAMFFDKSLSSAEGINIYRVKYELDNGLNGVGNYESYASNQTLTLADATKAGYKFDGWYTTSTFETASKVTELNASSVTSGDTITLYAKFVEPTTYSITYILNGGTNNVDNPTSYTELEKITLKAATKADHRFDGWYTTADFQVNTRVTELSKMVGSVVLYAKFTELDKKNITYVLGDYAQNPTNAKEFYYITVGYTLPTPTVSQHCTFEGWYTTNNFAAGSEITAIATDATEDVTVYAKVSFETWTITLTTDKAELAFVDEAKTQAFASNNTITYNYYEAVTLPTLYYSDGTVFDGWIDDYDDAIEGWTAGEYNNNMTLRAVMHTPATYTVTFNSDGGTAVSSATVTEGGKVAKPTDPIKAADAEYTYTFAGWYNGETAWNFDTDTVTANVTLTAKWTATAVEPASDEGKKSGCSSVIGVSAGIVWVAILAAVGFIVIKKKKEVK